MPVSRMFMIIAGQSKRHMTHMHENHINRRNEGLTIFLFHGSLKASSDRSFCGKSFAFGMTLAMRINAFRTGAGGFTSSAIFSTTNSQKIFPKMSEYLATLLPENTQSSQDEHKKSIISGFP